MLFFKKKEKIKFEPLEVGAYYTYNINNLHKCHDLFVKMMTDKKYVKCTLYKEFGGKYHACFDYDFDEVGGGSITWENNQTELSNFCKRKEITQEEFEI